MPQGNSLQAVEFSSSVGYAAGGFGTLVRTADAGATWSGVRTGTTADFNRVEVIDADSVVVASTCVLRRTDDAGDSLRRLPFTPSEHRCSRRLTDVSFPDANTGYLLLENGGVLKTSDGGRSFSPRTAVPGTPQGSGPAVPTAVAFSSPDVGLATTSSGQLFRTTDGGQSWAQEFSAGGSLNGLFVSGSAAVVVGANSTFAVSSDGGGNWTRTLSDPAYTQPFDLTSVRCGANGACVMTSRNGSLVRTSDAGKSFQIVGVNGDAAAFATGGRAVAVGAFGATFVSNDSGSSFARLGGALNVGSLGRLRATSASVAHVAGARGALGRTTNAGQTWTNVGVATSENVLDVSFPTTDSGYALDVTGGLFKTENGGSSWGILDTGTTQRPNAVIAPDAQTALLVGPSGMLRSTDGGQSFSQVSDKDVRRRTLEDVDRAGSSVVVYGPRVIAFSGNRGRTWSKIPRPSGREVLSADFLSAKAGHVLVGGGRVYLTRNGGKSWAESLGVGTHAGTQIAFGDSSNGWLAVEGFSLDGGYVLRTSDGGLTWRPQLVGPGEIGSVAAGTGSAGFVHMLGSSEGQRTQLLATGTGGDAGTPSTLALSTKTPVISRSRKVEIRGTLARARGGEQIVVSFRSLKGGRWGHEVVTAATNGGFNIERRVAKSTLFVAQWRGDEESAAAGSAALTVSRERGGG